MKCLDCHKEVQDGMKFCGHCGNPMPVQPAELGESSAAPDQSLGDEATIREAPGEMLPPRSLGDIETLSEAGDGSDSRKSGPGTPLSERYELLEEIGRGGFAVVWKARDRKLGRTVAVKRLLPERLEGKLGKQTLKRFEKEASSIARLNHRNIVTVYDHDRDSEGHYIVMEYVDGGTLKEYLKSRGGKLETGEAVRLVRGIAQGLGYAHRNNLIHRDIKPANVLLGRDGDELVPKIVDFGLARVGTESELSISGFGMGTPWYMPPEQRRNAKGVNHTADIYALGKTLYELVSGEVPDNVDPDKVPDPGLMRVILKCVKSKPEERYFSCEDLLRVLEGDATAPAGLAPGGKREGVCPSCGELNPDGAKYCGKCGTGMVRPCPECGTENSIYRKYCVSCGTDVEGFLKTEEALGKMKGYLESRKFGRVIKEAELLGEKPFEAKGKKGKEILEDIYRLRSEASEKQSAKNRHASTARQSYEDGKYPEAREEIESYEDIAGDLSEELRQLQEKIIRAEVAVLEEELDKKFRAGEFSDINNILHAYRSRIGRLPEELKALEEKNRKVWLESLLRKFSDACARLRPDTAEAILRLIKGIAGPGDTSYELLSASLKECRRKQKLIRCKRILIAFAVIASIAAVVTIIWGSITVIGNIRFNYTISSAQRAIDRGNWERAVNSTDRALSLRENCPEAQSLSQQARSGAHQAKLESFLESARKAIERRDWEKAKSTAEQAIGLQAGHRQATELLNQVKEQIRQESIERFLKVAREAIEREDWEGAIKAAEQAIVLKSGHQEAMVLLNQARDVSRQESIERFLKLAREAIEREDWEGAIKAAEQAIALQPGHWEATALLNQAKDDLRKEKIDGFLKLAREAADQKAWEEAIKNAEQAISLQAGHREAMALMNKAKEQVRQEKVEGLLKSAKKAKNSKIWSEVYSLIEQVLILDPGNNEALAMKNAAKSKEFSWLLEQAKEFERAEKWTQAYKLAERALACKPNDRQVLALLSRLSVKTIQNQLWKSPFTGMEFIWIEALNTWVGRYQVTNGEYRKKKPKHNSGSFSGHPLSGDRQPVVQVNFNDMKRYAEWMTEQDRSFLPKGYRYRLPSEAEFMIYCECGDGRQFPWGNNWPPKSGQAGNYHGQEGAGSWSKISNYNDGHPVTCDVEKSWANPWGLYGVGGNVWEACASDASGESFGAWRGASWGDIIQGNLHCSYRLGYDGSFRNYDYGFRLVLSREGL